MKKVQGFENLSVMRKFQKYPKEARLMLLEIRRMILSLSIKNDSIGEIEETLKWNEPAYVARHGSVVRIDWKKKSADSVMVYFNCKTTLVSTFKKKYKDIFTFEGNRAIVLSIEKKIPKKQLQDCIELSLTYKLWKN